jgi:hypothetical protein
MLGLRVSSGVWWQLEPPPERDELVPFIFFKAPKIFQPMPFIVEAQKTRTNKNNSKQVMLVKANGNSYPKVVPLIVWVFLQQRNEREISWIQTWEKIQWNPESKECEREWVKCWMRAQHPPLGLYLKSSGTKHPRRRRAQRLVGVGGSGAQVPLSLVWLNPRWLPSLITRAHYPPTVTYFYALVPSQSLLRKDVQKYFSKDSHAKKYF